MKTVRKAGIWMDHSIAHINEVTNDNIETKTLTRDFSYAEKKLSLNKGENLMHNKEQQHQAFFYKKLGEVIRNYDEVILFGATSAKTELYYILKKDHHFDKIKIDIKHTDKMKEEYQHAFVKQYFNPLVTV